jgi:peptidoglycan/LPS O-acetylase OafA/YrhL
MKRIPSLDGLRAISIVLVVLGHLADRHYVRWEFWHFYANTGVRIFFVISGYLITQILLHEQEKTGTISLKDFYVRRAFRIFPAAFVFLTILSIAFWHELRWYQMATALLYMASLGFTQPWFLMHLWSLSVEEQFYLVWPGVLRRWQTHAASVLLAVVVLAPCFSVLLYVIRARHEYFLSFPSTADALAVGCLVALCGSRLPTMNRYAGFIFLPALVLVPIFPLNTLPRTLLATLVLRPALNFSIAGLLIIAVHNRFRFLNVAPVVWLGRISYSLYLWQQPFTCAPSLSSRYVLWFGLACACLSYYLVEQPMLRLRERLSTTASPNLGGKALQARPSAA